MLFDFSSSLNRSITAYIPYPQTILFFPFYDLLNYSLLQNMADALVSKVMKELSSIINRELEQEVRLVVGVKKEVKKLTSNFQAIQAVLADAEERQLKDEHVKHWLDRLKDVSYDMDDVLDEWSTSIAKSQIEVNRHPHVTTWKVSSFGIFSCFRFGGVGLRRDIAHKIKELNERIDEITIEKDRFNFKSLEVGIEQFEHQKTAPVIDVSEVKGREKEKNRVMNMLLSESSQEPTLRIISVIGMGGIGKTTLAKLVYNDNKVETHFHKRIWVCVPDLFEEIKIAKAILEVLEGQPQNLKQLSTILERIQESIRGKKFLLVLDNVWNEDSTKWEQLKISLNCGLPGSRILETTRSKNVASSMGSTSTDILELGLLSKEECWSLFGKVAFFGKTNSEYENLKDIGSEIAAKCKGLPLAAKSLGSLLRFKRSREEWESVLKSSVWEIKEAESNLLAPLWLSYYDLPSEMRRCFSYCAVFPKDYTIERDALIKLWMAQGYLQETQNKEMEVMGHECFEILAARSFFQDFVKDEFDGSIIKCKMHDIVHDFAQFLTKNECFRVEVDGLAESKIGSLSREARHSMIVLNYETTFPPTIHSFEKLRSLLVGGHPSINAALPNLINHLSCLRTLSLPSCDIEEVPSNIGKLIHLRQVNLCDNKIQELPKEMCELYNMQTLDVSRNALKKLPDNVGKLVQLRHLSVFHLCGLMMRGLEGLSSLRELDELYLSGSEVSNLRDLKNLNHLQGFLWIRWLEDVTDPEDAKKAELKSKEHLVGLGLDFSKTSNSNRLMIRDDEVLEAFEPPPLLETLWIHTYRGIRGFPSWIMSLTRLKRVTLSYCVKIENLPPFGKLPSLENLQVKLIDGVIKVGRELLGLEIDDRANAETGRKGKGEMASPSDIIAFPKLKSLSFQYLRNWEEWDDGSWTRANEDKTKMSIMPCLRSLTIRRCPVLKALPDYLYQSTTLEELEIIDSPTIAKQFQEGWPNISHTPNIKIKTAF